MLNVSLRSSQGHHTSATSSLELVNQATPLTFSTCPSRQMMVERLSAAHVLHCCVQGFRCSAALRSHRNPSESRFAAGLLQTTRWWGFCLRSISLQSPAVRLSCTSCAGLCRLHRPPSPLSCRGPGRLLTTLCMMSLTSPKHWPHSLLAGASWNSLSLWCCCQRMCQCACQAQRQAQHRGCLLRKHCSLCVQWGKCGNWV